MNNMNGMGDMFTYPTEEGVSPQQFFEQQILSAAMPVPAPGSMAARGLPWDVAQTYEMPIEPQPMDVPTRPSSWETAPAPWEQPPIIPGMPPALTPQAAPVKAQAIQAQDKKAAEAAQAAKVAADNAIRAAQVGAPKVAQTNAATAKAAATVAASVATSPAAQQSAAIAKTEATKAVAAANVAVANANANGGMGDWLELSGLGQGGFMDTLNQYKWWIAGGLAAAGAFYYAKQKGWV